MILKSTKKRNKIGRVMIQKSLMKKRKMKMLLLQQAGKRED